MRKCAHSVRHGHPGVQDRALRSALQGTRNHPCFKQADGQLEAVLRWDGEWLCHSMASIAAWNRLWLTRPVQEGRCRVHDNAAWKKGLGSFGLLACLPQRPAVQWGMRGRQAPQICCHHPPPLQLRFSFLSTQQLASASGLLWPPTRREKEISQQDSGHDLSHHQL